MQSGCWAPTTHPASGTAVSEGDHTLGFCETEGVGIRAVIVFVVSPLTVVAVLADWTVPDSVGGMELFAEAAVVREWKGSLRAAGRRFFAVILGHSVPPEVTLMSVFYGCG